MDTPKYSMVLGGLHACGVGMVEMLAKVIAPLSAYPALCLCVNRYSHTNTQDSQARQGYKRRMRRHTHHAAADGGVRVDIGVQVLPARGHENVPIHLVPHTVPTVRREALDLSKETPKEPKCYCKSACEYSERRDFSTQDWCVCVCENDGH